MESKKLNQEEKKCREIGNCFEFMPKSDGLHSQNELSPLFLKHPIADQVTFFGGTFNPFHQGHRACLDLCPEKNILIVLDHNPFKEKKAVDFFPYQFFLKLAQDLKDTPYSLYPGFLDKNVPNPTASWLPLVKIKEKNFLMGDDSFMSLLTWNNPDILIQALTKLYIVPRSFKLEDYKKQEAAICRYNEKLKIIYLADHPYKKISSTALKQN